MIILMVRLKILAEVEWIEVDSQEGCEEYHDQQPLINQREYERDGVEEWRVFFQSDVWGSAVSVLTKLISVNETRREK